jgi:hypothetical protein
VITPVFMVVVVGNHIAAVASENFSLRTLALLRFMCLLTCSLIESILLTSLKLGKFAP